MLRPVILQLEAKKRRKHEAYVKFFVIRDQNNYNRLFRWAQIMMLEQQQRPRLF